MGMTIDTAIKELITMRGGLKYALTIPIYSDEDKEDREINKIQLEAIIMAIDTMRKYQKIQNVMDNRADDSPKSNSKALGGIEVIMYGDNN